MRTATQISSAVTSAGPELSIRGAVLNSAGVQGPYAQSRPITIDDLVLTAPGDREVLVRVEAAGLCHSDLSVVNGVRPRPLPMLLGHEAAGIVEAVGPGVGSVRLGQRVVMTFLPRCGRCEACLTDGKLPCSSGSKSNDQGVLLAGSSHLTRSGESCTPSGCLRFCYPRRR
jgi:alcohol dehydrogenase